MFGRFTARVVLALCCLSPSALYAQYAPGQPVYSPPPGSAGQVAAPMAAGYAPSPYVPAQPASYGGGHYAGEVYAPYPPAPPVGYGYGYNYCPPTAGGMIEERVPDDRGWDYESPVDQFLANLVKNSWVRLSYLNWNMDEPGNALVGAPVEGVIDPREPFPINIGGVPVGTARVANLDEIGLNNRNGIEGKIGIPLTFGTIEGSIFALEKKSEEIVATDLPSEPAPGLQHFVAISTLTNGEIGRNLFLFDRSFRTTFTAQLWGTEGNFVWDPYVAGEGLKFQPLVGFRYLNHMERLRVNGVFDQFGALPEDLILNSQIESTTRNHIYAPQIGLRTELVHRWFTVGVEPKISFGVNNYEAIVRTEEIITPGEAPRTTVEDGFAFSPIGSLDVYGRIHVHENFSIFVEYDLMIGAKFARPHDSILYNDLGVGAGMPGIVADVGFENVLYSGIAIGGEFRFK